MIIAFLVVLATAWIAVFLPAIVRARYSSPMSAAYRWRRRMELIVPRHAPSRGSGRWIVVPESRDDLGRESFRRGQRLRRWILEGMIAACFLSLGAALYRHGHAWDVQVTCDASLALYLTLLMEAKRRRHVRVRRVRLMARRRRLGRVMPPWTSRASRRHFARS